MVLTNNEAAVLDVIRSQHRRWGDAVANATIRSRSGLSYDATNRALTSVVAKGLAIKPSRGYYVPAEVRDVS